MQSVENQYFHPIKDFDLDHTIESRVNSKKTIEHNIRQLLYICLFQCSFHSIVNVTGHFGHKIWFPRMSPGRVRPGDLMPNERNKFCRLYHFYCSFPQISMGTGCRIIISVHI